MRAELEDAREAERARIARDLHDEVGQSLLVLRMDLVQLLAPDAPPAARLPLLLGALERLDGALAGLRLIINNLHPLVLDQSMADACAWQVQQFRARTGLSCRLCITGRANGAEAGSRHKAALFRVLQEALSNVARHAGAAHVTVALDLQPGQVELTVIDDGIGYVPRAGADGGHGVRGMHERAQLLGGQLRIAAIATGGTVLHLWLPLSGERRQRHGDRRRRPGAAAPRT